MIISAILINLMILFNPTIEMHDNEGLSLESIYDKALDDGPMVLDNKNYNAIESGFDPIIFEMDRNYVHVDHEKPVLSDNYLNLFMMLMKIIMIEENMVVGVLVSLTHLCFC